MDKILRRVRAAERKVARRALVDAKETFRLDRTDARKLAKEQTRAARKQLVNERVRRQEEWLQGPIAPRRDLPAPPVGADDAAAWGTTFTSVENNKPQLDDRQMEAHCEWAGGA